MCLRNSFKFLQHKSLPMYQHKMDLIPKRKKQKQFNLFIKKKKKKKWQQNP